LKDCVLISVPHTGTWRTISILTDAGYHDAGLSEPIRHDFPVIRHGHMLKETQIQRAIEWARSMPLILPLRHPYRVAESWKKRSRPMRDFIPCFRTFLDRFMPFDPFIVPVDSEHRDEALAVLSMGLGVDLKTDWAVVNGKKGLHKLRLEDCRPSADVIELAAEMKPFLSRFY